MGNTVPLTYDTGKTILAVFTIMLFVIFLFPDEKFDLIVAIMVTIASVLWHKKNNI